MLRFGDQARLSHNCKPSCLHRLARWVTRSPNGTPAKSDLNACELLSVNQTIIMRVLVIGLIALKYGNPAGLAGLRQPKDH